MKNTGYLLGVLLMIFSCKSEKKLIEPVKVIHPKLNITMIQFLDTVENFKIKGLPLFLRFEEMNDTTFVNLINSPAYSDATSITGYIEFKEHIFWVVDKQPYHYNFYLPSDGKKIRFTEYDSRNIKGLAISPPNWVLSFRNDSLIPCIR